MNNNTILETDILDIIFDKRNKAYGAYDLRKYYDNRLKRALGLMLLMATAFIAFTLLPKREREIIAKPFQIAEAELTNVELIPEVPEVKPEIPKPADPVVQPVNQTLFTSTVAIVPDNTKTDSIRTLLPNTQIGNQNTDNPTPVAPVVTPVKPGPPAVAAVPGIPKIDKTVPMEGDAVDVQPAFPGGMDGLKKFLEKHLQNPYDLENGATVNVKVRFVVGYNGKLQGFETVQDGGDVYNKEVMRVLRKMPEWEPGKAKGENVSVYYTIPVKFVMSN